MEHQEIEELLAGYSLGALSGTDAESAGELLAIHVPTCMSCRRLLDGFQAVVGDLALVPNPHAAPELLWARLEREISEPELGTPPRRFPAWLGAAAGVIVLGLGLWNATLHHRVNRAEGRQTAMINALNLIGQPNSHVVALNTAAGTPATGRLAVAYAPGEEHAYVFGAVPSPHRGHVYRLWFTLRGVPVATAATFIPEGGSVIIVVGRLDPTQYDGIWVTEEREGRQPNPSASPLLTGEVTG